jgi:hypothetical protein
MELGSSLVCNVVTPIKLLYPFCGSKVPQAYDALYSVSARSCPHSFTVSISNYQISYNFLVICLLERGLSCNIHVWP